MPGGHGSRDRKGWWRNPGIGWAFQAEWPRLTLDRQTQQVVKCEMKQNLSKQGCGRGAAPSLLWITSFSP